MIRPLPPSLLKEPAATVRNLIDWQVALTDLMEEEASHMAAMRVGKVGELQDRKLKLTAMLERAMHYLKMHPEVLLAATLAEKEELRCAGERFRIVMKKNYDTLLVARAVNRSVVKCVTQVVGLKERNPTYNAQGMVRKMVETKLPPISVTYNQTV